MLNFNLKPKKNGYTLLEMAIAITVLTVAVAMLSVGIRTMTEQSKILVTFSMTAKNKMAITTKLEAAATGILKDAYGDYLIELSSDHKVLTIQKKVGPLKLELSKMRGLEDGEFQINNDSLGFKIGGESYWVPIIAEYQ